jgi:type VI secretion system protein
MKLYKQFIGINKKLLQPVLASLILVACSGEPRPDLSIDSVSIYADPDANQNSAIAVDLVLVYDLELVNTLAKLSASKYFSMSKQLLLDNPTMLDIWHWELVPGQIVDNFTPDQEDGDAFAAFVFANYITDGDHRVKVAPDGVIKIILMKDDLKNYAVFNATDPKVGKTVTDKPNPWVAGEGEDSFAKMKKGPVTAPSKPCKKAVQPPVCCPPPQPVCCPPPVQPCPISKQSLAPLPLLKPCPKKKLR